MLGWKIFGACGVPSRFHPYGAMKDWNECLQEMGRQEMKCYLVQELHPKPVEDE
jgi:hypothetical protein